MTSDVVTTTSSTPVVDATRLLLERRVAALPVVDDGRLVGIVSELDLLRDRVTGDPRAHVRRTEPSSAGAVARVVADVMTRDVVALTDAHDAASFATLLVEHGMKSVPVVRGDRLVGIVGRRDLLRLLARDDSAVLADLGALLDAERAGVGVWEVTVVDGAVTLVGTGTAEQAEGVRRLAQSVPGVVRVDVREG